MIVILGLIIFIAAVVVGVAGVLTNSASGHELTGGFSVFGHEMIGSTGTLFLYGIVVGAAALFGLILLLTGVRRRSSRRGSVSRRGLKQSRGDTASAGRGRDDLVDQREPARADNANARGNDSLHGDRTPASNSGRWSRRHLFGHRSAAQ
ncbi:hypothetical protein EDD90_10447 [Streptomyces sp. Ag109_O5-1]|uniref:hypothetical protein n=1 Tax=Streptomyces sp. Ag109_O5-1 TaxID=1938851 RepID=UPI000F4E1FA5|nr:hypothetical protein [Streptomyces sp. Ag109_O5-1]RPE47030.1 hypothetical protein EDD90_10447 [Streptomyces sp. Ag109_O5-1]